MYLSHYHLKVKPFQINPDPKFLWMGESHRKAFHMFLEGIAENRGLILLIGDVGTGKTTLINTLLDSLDEDTLVASVQYPGFGILDFYNYLAACFNMGKKFSNKGDFLVQFIHFLHEKYTQNKNVLLIIDEAQGLPNEILDEIRLLSNLERMKTKLLSIFLVGQNEMEKILSDPENKTLTKSITATYYLAPLKIPEVKNYIHFRLQVAGADYRIFSRGAIREIAISSKCYPRLINVICDHALLTGYVQGKTKIDAAIIKECAAEHQLDEPGEIEPVRADNHIEKQIDETASVKRLNYHWTLPAVLLVSLFILIVAGYFTYLKYDSRAIHPSSHKSNKKAAFAVVAENNRHPNDIESVVGNRGKEKVIAGDRQGATFVEEDLGPDESSDENRRKPDALSGDEKRIRSSPDLIVSTEEINKGSPAPIPDSKLVLNIPPDVKKLPQDIYSQLDVFLAAISDYAEPNIRIIVYTDSGGNAGQNEMLSTLWAEAVKAYFIKWGMDPARINAIGMKDIDPGPPYGTQAGGKKNHRIEIEVIQD